MLKTEWFSNIASNWKSDFCFFFFCLFVLFSHSCQSSEEFFYQNNHTNCLSFQVWNGHDTCSTFYSFYARSQLPIDISLFLFPFDLFFLKKRYILKTVKFGFFFTFLIKIMWFQLSHNIQILSWCTLLTFGNVTYSADVYYNFKHLN